MVPNTDGTFVAIFGIQNSASVTVAAPVGVSNSFSPGLADRRQPTSFTTGTRDFWVVVPFDGTALTWTLGGSQATATGNSVQCPPFPTGGEEDDSNGDLVKFPPPAPPQTPDPAQIPAVASNNLFPLVNVPVVPRVEPPRAGRQRSLGGHGEVGRVRGWRRSGVGEDVGPHQRRQKGGPFGRGGAGQ